MSSASDRRKSSGGGGGGEGANWMDTYGDLVTLLMTFFVLLFSFSTIDAAKFKALASSFTAGPTIVSMSSLSIEEAISRPDPGIEPPRSSYEEPMTGPNVDEPVQSAAELKENLRQLYENMTEYVGKNNINAEVQLVDDDYQIVLVFNDLVFFRTGEAVLVPESIPILDEVIEMFKLYENMYAKLSVEGHTDNVPISTARYPSNWYLSFDRATNVLYYLMESGEIDPKRLHAGGYGEYDPIDTNETEEGRARNRRVEFVLETDRPR